MTRIETAERTTDAIFAIPAAAMGAALERADEVDLEGYEFYVLGRGGVMGDVSADVICSALTWFEPEWVRSHYQAGTRKTTLGNASRAWAGMVAEWGDAGLSSDLPLERLCELTGRIIENSPSAVAPLFAGWRVLPEPDSLSRRTMHRLYALRELRAGLHAGAVRAAGLLPLEALAIRTPVLAPGWGWTDPLPEVSHLVDQWRAAEDGTNRGVGRLFECLSDAEALELAEAAEAVLGHVGMAWWTDESSPTLNFGPRPE
ncbi:hypothetical protein R4P64_31460 [Rhodococcus sp. IEGM 1366]|uniref:helix-turn-helix domain-containing protein n=1 Tax=Rhodococcus sp. IEGM 1366 TaxID=3082223 RepID=UPI002953BA14|nr:hypothetical protein [Rhodococcus sp. IEGM 1366]MDV8071038.1 hypothetical protein [Rhodococcus sp. IEGM 1366]